MFDGLKRISSPFVTDYLLDEAYDQTYGIFDHQHNRTRPLAHVAMHPAEDTFSTDPMRIRLREYIKHGVKEITGIDFITLLDMSTYDVELIIDQCKVQNARLARLAEETKDKIK